MPIPTDLHYTKEHEWTRIEGFVATIGITDFAQSELGDIIFVEFPAPGQEFTRNDPFGTIEAVKTVADLYTPLSGRILEINPDLEEDPGLINSDPYGAGWIIKLELTRPGEMETLLTPDDYQALIG